MENWHDIKLALEVARHGGLTPAARHLGLSHSTLSRRIASLEKQQGVRLFDRLPEGLTPTQAGREMIATAERVASEMDALNLTLAGQDAEAAGELKITAPSLLIDLYLAPLLTEFARANPQVHLHINAAHAPLNLQRREADVAIRATNAPPENLFGRRISQQDRAVYASQAYFDFRPDLTANAPMDAGFDWLGFDPWSADSIANLSGSRQIARFDDMAALLGSLRAGLGIAKLPAFIAHAHPDLVRLTSFQVEPYFDLWVLTHPTLKEVARVRHFMRFIAARMNSDKSFFMINP